MQATGDSYPAQFTFDPPERIANWRPLVHWLLAIPHLVVLWVLRLVSQVLGVVSWFAIVFTGRLPPAMADFQAMYMRYYIRALTYYGFLREEYPPFTFEMTAEDPGDDPRVRFVATPDLGDRNRVTVGFRFLLVIPHFLVLFVLFIGIWFAYLIAFFAVLFTGRWPEGLRDFVLGVARWWVRVDAYWLLLTDEYPPFALD